MSSAIRINRRAVTYRDGAGFEKAAFIIGTRESVKEGTNVPRPAEGHAHLYIVPATGKPYVRQNVKLGSGPRTFSL